MLLCCFWFSITIGTWSTALYTQQCILVVHEAQLVETLWQLIIFIQRMKSFAQCINPDTYTCTAGHMLCKFYSRNTTIFEKVLIEKCKYLKFTLNFNNKVYWWMAAAHSSEVGDWSGYGENTPTVLKTKNYICFVMICWVRKGHKNILSFFCLLESLHIYKCRQQTSTTPVSMEV